MTSPCVCVVSSGFSKPFWRVLKIFELYLQCKKYRCKGSRAPISHYAALQSLSVFSFTKSQWLILEISVTYRLVSYLLADNVTD